MTKKTSSTEQDGVTTPANVTVVTPLPLDAASGDARIGAGSPPPPDAQVRKKTNFDKVLEKIEEIEMMAAHGHKELRDTIRARCTEIREILT